MQAISIVCLLAWAVAWLATQYFPDLPARKDDGLYLCLAKSLWSGEGYRDPSAPLPMNLHLAPSGFPLLLASYWALFHPHLAWLKVFLMALFAAGSVPVFLWARRRLGTGEAWLLAAAVMAHPVFVYLGNSVKTEVLLIPLLYAALYGWERCGEEGGRKWFWLTALCFVVLSRVRVVAYPFSLAFLVFLLARRKWGVAAVSALLFLAWYGLERHWKTRLPGGADYGAALEANYPLAADPWTAASNLAAQTFGNFRSFAESFYAHQLFPYAYGLWEMDVAKKALVLSIFLWGGAGLFLFWRSGAVARYQAFALAGSFALVLGFPGLEIADFFRYAAPYAPFWILFFLLPWQALARRAPRWRWAAAAAAIALIVDHAAANRRYPFYELYIESRHEFAALLRYVGEAAGKPGALLSPDKYYAYLKTGVPGFNFRYGPDFLKSRAWLQRDSASAWIVLGPPNRNMPEVLLEMGYRLETAPLARFGPWHLVDFKGLEPIPSPPPSAPGADPK